jgi:Ulp1 family protease
MLKRLVATMCLAIILLAPNGQVSYGAKPDIKSDLSLAEEKINATVLQSVQQQLKELEKINMSSISDSDKNALDAKKSELRKIKNYKDFASRTSVETAVTELRERGYEVDADFENLCREIESYQKQNPGSDPKDIVLYLEQKTHSGDYEVSARFFSVAFNTANAYSVSYTTWTKLTTAEKLLVAASPTAAVITQALQKKAFDFTSAKFGYNPKDFPGALPRGSHSESLKT